MNNIGKNIKKARKSAGLTQEQLAYSCGISSTAVRHWEAGRHKPSKEHLHIIAKECDVTVEYILHNMDEEDIAEVMSSSRDILHNFTIAKATQNEWKCIQPLSLRVQNKYQSIISALAMCGYTPEAINDIDNFFEFMSPVMESVKNSIELYMKTLNNRKDDE